jgi:hypothetical protein
MNIKVLSIIICFYALQTVSIAQDMLKDAGKELPTWLEKIPREQEQQYGFATRDDFAFATLGLPYELYMLAPSFFKDTALGKTNYLLATGEWRIPVLVRGKFITMVTVQELNSQWHIVDLGADILARELDGCRSLPDLKNAQALKMLSVYQLHGDFLFADDPTFAPDRITMFPLASAQLSIPALSKAKHEPQRLSDLLPMMKSLLQKQ